MNYGPRPPQKAVKKSALKRLVICSTAERHSVSTHFYLYSLVKLNYLLVIRINIPNIDFFIYNRSTIYGLSHEFLRVMARVKTVFRIRKNSLDSP